MQLVLVEGGLDERKRLLPGLLAIDKLQYHDIMTTRAFYFAKIIVDSVTCGFYGFTHFAHSGADGDRILLFGRVLAVRVESDAVGDGDLELGLCLGILSLTTRGVAEGCTGGCTGGEALTV